ncbi:hypothetical protein [Methylobacterium sp. 17Sr1-1]|uniref:hypothetical protein n=1 Tax=Methylobacterium sp. 17Sr1-1 TaxID=2202826 RepID=UPI000D6F91F4|nr:hypothetical protein [Methylobacterium sp. 17Sr1-1]AWN51418.1 hypothetical protein DK412_06725 [Methylobacterium sp. 17Sr1-1]
MTRTQFAARFALLFAAAVPAAPAAALDMRFSPNSGNLPGVGQGQAPIKDDTLAINRADGKLFWRRPDGTLGTSTLLNALPSGRSAVEQGRADDLLSAPSGLTILRSLAARFAERPSVIDYGVDMTGVADSTAALTAALNSGKPISAPCGTIRVLSTVAVTTRPSFLGAGPCTSIKYDAPSGSAVKPVIDIQPAAAGGRLDNFSVDHQANTKNFTPNTVYGGNIIASSAILVQADDTALNGVTVRNGYDNCIAVVQFAGNTATAVPGSPKRYSIQGARTNACGVGSTPKAGAGIDVGTGSRGVVNDLVDVGSYGAFILDVGAGGQGTFSNMVGIDTALDPALGYSYTFYIGSTDSTFTNLTSIGAKYSGLWHDGFATNTTINNVYIKASAAVGAKLKAGASTISNLIVNSAGFGSASGTVDAVELDSTAGSLVGLTVVGLKVQDEFNKARYGVNKLGSGVATGSIIGADLSGAVTAINNVPGTFGVIDGQALGGAWTAYTPTVSCATGGQSLGSATASATYRRVGKTVTVNFSTISIANAGTCAGAVNVNVPSTAATRTAFVGAETAVVGTALAGALYEGANTVQIKRADGNSPSVSGYVLTGTVQYEEP